MKQSKLYPFGNDDGNNECDTSISMKLIENFGFDEIINDITYTTDWLVLYDKLGENYFHLFIKYFIESDKITLDDKKNLFFDKIFYYNGNTGVVYGLLNNDDLVLLAKFCLKNGLIEPSYEKKYTSFLVYIEEELYDIITNENFNGPINTAILSKLTEEQKIEIFFSKKFRKYFFELLVYQDIINTFSFTKNIQEQIIDIIFDDYKNITAFDGKVRNYGGPTYKKVDFNKTLSKLIEDNTDYYFTKLINLEQNSFRKVVQKTHQTAILWYLNHTDELLLNNELMKNFFKKMVKNIGILNLKDNRSRPYGNNYFYYIEKYYQEAFEHLDIKKLFDEKSHLECDNKYFVDSLLNTKNWFHSIKITKNIEIFRNVFTDKKVIDYIITNFSEKEILEYMLILRRKLCYYMLDENNLFKIIEHIHKTDENSLIYEKIFNEEIVLDFLNLFPGEFDTFSSVLNFFKENGLYKDKIDTEMLERIVLLIRLFRTSKNIKISTNKSDINKYFVSMIKDIFLTTLNTDILLLGQSSNFFDIEITSLEFFAQEFKEDIVDLVVDSKEDIGDERLYYKTKNPFFSREALFLSTPKEEIIKIKQKHIQIQTSIFYSSNIISNLGKICNTFGIKFTMGNIMKIEKKFNDFLGNNEANYVYLNSFLNEGFLENMDFIINYFIKVHNKKLNINELLLVLNKFTTIKGLPINLNELLNASDLLDKHIADFDMKDIIKIEGNKVYIGDLDFLENIGKNTSNFYWLDIFEKFYNFTKKSFVDFLIFVNNTDLFNFHPTNHHRGDIKRLSNVIGEPNNYKEKTYIDAEPVLLYRVSLFLIQKAINEGDFSKLESQLQAFRKFTSNDYDFNIVKLKLDKILLTTSGFISSYLVQVFIFWQIDSDRLSKKNKLVCITDVIARFQEITGIEKIEQESYTDRVFISFLGQILDDMNRKGIGLFQIFIDKFPNNNGVSWKLDDFRKGGKLENMTHHFVFLHKLLKKTNFSLNQLIDLFSYNIEFDFFNKNIDTILSYNDKLYGYFVLSIRNNITPASYIDIELDKNLPVNIKNFTDFMNDKETLIKLPKDDNIVFTNIKPFSKAWFLENPKRKKYLKQDNIKLIRDYGLIVGLGILGEDLFKYVKDSKKIYLNAKLNFCRENCGFSVDKLIKYKGKKKKFAFQKDVLSFYERLFYFRSNHFSTVLTENGKLDLEKFEEKYGTRVDEIEGESSEFVKKILEGIKEFKKKYLEKEIVKILKENITEEEKKEKIAKLNDEYKVYIQKIDGYLDDKR